MAFDEGLAERTRDIALINREMVEKKMFGGIGFMLNGNMACGIHKDKLVVRVGPDNYDDAVSHSNVQPFDITGRAMKGWVMVDHDGIEEDRDLKTWIQSGIDFAASLPPK